MRDLLDDEQLYALTGQHLSRKQFLKKCVFDFMRCVRIARRKRWKNWSVE